MTSAETKKQPLGVSEFLPPHAAARLVRGAADARKFEPDSLQRKLVLQRAIDEVKKQYPEYFSDTRRRS